MLSLALAMTALVPTSAASVGLELEVQNLSFTDEHGNDPEDTTHFQIKDTIRFTYGGDQLRLDVDHRHGGSIVEVVVRHFDERAMGDVDTALTHAARVLTLVKLQVAALMPAPDAATVLGAVPQVVPPNPNPYNVEGGVAGVVQPSPGHGNAGNVIAPGWFNTFRITLRDEDLRPTFDHWIYDIHITAGFRLDEIIDVFRVLYNVNVNAVDGPNNHMSLLKRRAYDAAQVSAALLANLPGGPWTNPNDVRGYLALLHLNMATGATMGGGALTKNQVLILSRVPMRLVYESLPLADRTRLLNNRAAVKAAIIDRIFWYDHTRGGAYPDLAMLNHWNNQAPRVGLLASTGMAIDQYFEAHAGYGANLPDDGWERSHTPISVHDGAILDSYLESGLGGVPLAVNANVHGVANVVEQAEIFGNMTETPMDGALVPCEIRQLPGKRITSTGNLDVRANSAYLALAKIIRFTRGGARTNAERL